MFNRTVPVAKAQMKPNFINGQTNAHADVANAAVVQAKINNQSTYSMVVDKLARPAIAAGLGLLYTSLYLRLPVMNLYGLQKAAMFGISSIIADYLGNFIFSAAKIKKELGMLDVEDIIVETGLGGVVYALLNKYYLGVNNRFMNDVIVGSAANGIAGVSALFLRMSF